MDLYTVSLATGAVGLGIMAFGGLSHGSHAGHGHASHIGVLKGRGAGGARGARGAGGGSGWRWSSLLSPRLIFSVLVGFGATGMAAISLAEPLRAGTAVAGATLFETLLVGPLWRFLFKFESREALTLESSIDEEAQAVTGFDKNGCGLVSIDVDGQVVQLLATLAADERALGVRIRSGDRVRIAEIDAERGRCTVTLPTR